MMTFQPLHELNDLSDTSASKCAQQPQSCLLYPEWCTLMKGLNNQEGTQGRIARQ